MGNPGGTQNPGPRAQLTRHGDLVSATFLDQGMARKPSLVSPLKEIDCLMPENQQVIGFGGNMLIFVGHQPGRGFDNKGFNGSHLGKPTIFPLSPVGRPNHQNHCGPSP